MIYTKTCLTVEKQIELLKSRGLNISNIKEAEHILHNISYYRLSAYMKSFQRYNDPDHQFMDWATFERIVDLYTFDRDLRLILLDAIERIEVAFRCSFIYQYGLKYGNNWYEDSKHFYTGFSKSNSKINSEIKKSKEVFIKHYKTNYLSPANPPAFMTLEILSFGQLSILFKNLSASDPKKAVGNHFGVNYKVLESWMEHLVYIRNMCAHHSRIWNRDLIVNKPTIPTVTSFSWLSINPVRQDKVYTSIVILAYILKQINPTSSFTGRLRSLLKRHPLINIEVMGFPKNWWKDPFWNEVYIPWTQIVRINYFRFRSIQTKVNRIVVKNNNSPY